MKMKNKHNDVAGKSTLAVLGAIIAVGFLGYCLYDTAMRNDVKDLISNGYEKLQGVEEQSLEGEPANQGETEESATEWVDYRDDKADVEVGEPETKDEENPPAFENPIQWLEQALRDLDGKEKRLLPRQFKLKRLNNKFTRKRTWAMSEEESWTDLLGELKVAYREGESGQFPVVFHDYTVEQQTLEHKIVQAHQLVVEQAKLRSTYGQQARRAKALGGKVDKVLTEIAHARRIVSIKLEIARTKKEFEGLDNIREDVGEILDTAEALVQQSDHLDLFELRENSRPSGFTHEHFNKIMETKE